MSNRENLIYSITKFLQNTINSHNEDMTIRKDEYFKLKKRIYSLVSEDFESDNNYLYFLRWINQPKRKAELYYFEKTFVNDNLEIGPFLYICNYLDGAKNRMNKN